MKFVTAQEKMKEGLRVVMTQLDGMEAALNALEEPAQESATAEGNDDHDVASPCEYEADEVEEDVGDVFDAASSIGCFNDEADDDNIDDFDGAGDFDSIGDFDDVDDFDGVGDFDDIDDFDGVGDFDSVGDFGTVDGFFA